MILTATDPLVIAIDELRSLFPEMRFGQLVANLVTAAGCTEINGIWDLEDEAILEAAHRLIENNSDRNSAQV